VKGPLSTPEFEAMLAAALVAAGAPPAVAALAPAALAIFISLVERHVGGEPLADILRATMPNDAAALTAERERTE
jgi:hypothetical protein